MTHELFSDDPEVMISWQKYVDDIAALWPASEWSVEGLWAEREICIHECRTPVDDRVDPGRHYIVDLRQLEIVLYARGEEACPNAVGAFQDFEYFARERRKVTLPEEIQPWKRKGRLLPYEHLPLNHDP